MDIGAQKPWKLWSRTSKLDPSPSSEGYGLGLRLGSLEIDGKRRRRARHKTDPTPPPLTHPPKHPPKPNLPYLSSVVIKWPRITATHYEWQAPHNHDTARPTLFPPCPMPIAYDALHGPGRPYSTSG